MKNLFNKLSKWMCGIASDKYAHFLCSMLIAFIASALLFALVSLLSLPMSKNGSAVLGFGVAYIIGVVKEKIDENKGGTFDFRERIVNVKLKDISAWSTEHLPQNWVTERTKTLRKVS